MPDRIAVRIVILLLAILALGQSLACGESSPAPHPKPAVVHKPSPAPVAVVVTVDPPEPSAAVVVEAPRPDVRGWCEPLVPAICDDAHPCSPAPDGTPRVCVRNWWGDGDLRACSSRTPTRVTRQWRRARARVVLEDRCGRACNRADLERFVALLAIRESTWRPWARHRLGPDLGAARRSWERLGHLYEGNPTAGDLERWGGGAGLFGMVPALWVWQWDPMAPPEILCGEPESIELLLRASRRAVRKLRSGIDCDGDGTREHHGHACDTTGCGPSWYDASLVLRGSLCPPGPEHLEAFVRRAEKRGLDPFARVTVENFGAPVPSEDQGEWAEEMRVRMDQVSRR